MLKKFYLLNNLCDYPFIRSFRRLFKTCGYSSTQHLEPMSEETTSEQFVVANESGSEFEVQKIFLCKIKKFGILNDQSILDPA